MSVPSRVQSAIVRPTFTPSSVPQHAATINITPPSRNTASQPNPKEDHTVEIVNNYLIEDIRGRITLSFDDFLDVIIRLTSDEYTKFSDEMREEIQPVIESKIPTDDPKMEACRAAWNDYKSTCNDPSNADNEEILCTALVELFNTAMAVLFNESSIPPLVFYDSSEKIVGGSYTVCKPDIAVTNIMFRRNDKRLYGVLNDSCLPASGSPSSRQRTGTEPFMAVDLLDKDWTLGHLYRHDLEGLTYVILIICCHYDMDEGSSGLRLTEIRPYNNWFTYSAEILYKMKNDLYKGKPKALPVTNFFKPFEPCLRNLLFMLRRGFTKKLVYETESYDDATALDGKTSTFDWDTLDNTVTYEAFIKALQAIGGDVEVVYPEPLALKREDFELPSQEDVTMEN